MQCQLPAAWKRRDAGSLVCQRQDEQGDEAARCKANDAKLQLKLEKVTTGIGKHTDVLKALIKGAKGETRPEHCKGMEGLVAEALKHGLKEAAKYPELQNIQILAQLQRMAHYGTAGLGSTTSYAKTLGLKDDEKKLKVAVADIYKSDQQTGALARAS